MSDTVVVAREMACTREEFLTWLAGLLGQGGFALQGNAAIVPLPPGELRIALEPRPPRRIGSLAMPVLAVRFAFADVEARARGDFLARFDLYTRRGGG